MATTKRVGNEVLKSGQKALIKEAKDAVKEEATHQVATVVGDDTVAGKIVNAADAAIGGAKKDGKKGAAVAMTNMAKKEINKAVNDVAKEVAVNAAGKARDAAQEIAGSASGKAKEAAKNPVAQRFDKDEPKQQEFKQMREARPEVAQSMQNAPMDRLGNLPKPDVPDLGPQRGMSVGVA